MIIPLFGIHTLRDVIAPHDALGIDGSMEFGYIHLSSPNRGDDYYSCGCITDS